MPSGLNAGTAWIKVAPDMRPFSAGVTSGAQSSGNTAGSKFTEGFKNKLKIGAAIGGALIVAGASKFLKDSISEASDLGESINAVNVTFGKSAAGITKLGRDAANSLGLSQSKFNGIAVQFSAFTKTIAGDGGNVTKVMKDLTGRGADFASVMNIEVDDALGLFQSGLAGETEPLRKYGIDLSAAAVESHAYAKGIATAGEELTEQQKVQARYSLLMQQTSKVQGDFKNTSDSLANSQRILGANWDNLQASVGSYLLPTLAKLSGWALTTGLPALKALGGFVRTEVLPPLGRLAAFVRDDLLPPLVEMGRFLWRNKEAVAAFVVVLAGFAILRSIVVAFRAFNLVLAMNPITLVVVALAALAAGLVYAYKKSDTFREIVDRAWAAVKRAIHTAWENVIKPALAAFGDFLRTKVGPAIQWLWNNVVKPTFAGIGKTIAFVWNNVVKPVFAAYKFYLENVVFPVIRFLWNNVVKPVFAGIGKTIGFVWNNIVKPVFSQWKAFLEGVVFPVIRFLWNNVVKPMFSAIGEKIRDTWNQVIKPTFAALKEGVGTIRGAFKTAVDGIAKAWDGLKKPPPGRCAFVINTVYNHGIVPMLSAIPGVSPRIHDQRSPVAVRSRCRAGTPGKDSCGRC